MRSFRTDINALGTTPTILYPPKKHRKQPRRLEPRGNQPPIVGPVLIEADYKPGATLTMVFDRAIDASTIVADAFIVDDGAEQMRKYGGIAHLVLSPISVRIDLMQIETIPPGNVTLFAAANNGIVTEFGGEPWGGVSGLALPFG